MAGANGANGLDLEQLLAGVRKGKLAQPELAQFEAIAHDVGERLTAYKAAMETYLAYMPNNKDFTFGRRMHGQGVEQALIGETGLIAAYDRLLNFGEQHPEAAAGFAIFELLKSYTRYTTKLTEGLYPESVGKSLVTGTGEIDAKEAVQRTKRKELFGMLAANLLDPNGVDYKLRKLLGSNFERWTALEGKVTSTYAISTAGSTSPQTTTPQVMPVTPTLKPLMVKPEGIVMWTGIIKYDPDKHRIHGQMVEYVRMYLECLSTTKPELVRDAAAQQNTTNLLGRLVGTLCQNNGLREVQCSVYVSQTGISPYIERMPVEKMPGKK